MLVYNINMIVHLYTLNLKRTEKGSEVVLSEESYLRSLKNQEEFSKCDTEPSCACIELYVGSCISKKKTKQNKTKQNKQNTHFGGSRERGLYKTFKKVQGNVKNQEGS